MHGRTANIHPLIKHVEKKVKEVPFQIRCQVTSVTTTVLRAVITYRTDVLLKLRRRPPPTTTLSSTVIKWTTTDCPNVQLSISVLHLKPVCHLQAQYWWAQTPSAQTGSYYSRRLKFHLFSFSSFFFFSGDKPATLISHCCQLNSTLSCNYFQYISIHISFRCHPNKIYKGSVVQSLICSTDPKTSTRIHIHTHTHTQASSHHPAHGVLKWELWRFLWNKKK